MNSWKVTFKRWTIFKFKKVMLVKNKINMFLKHITFKNVNLFLMDLWTRHALAEFLCIAVHTMFTSITGLSIYSEMLCTLDSIYLFLLNYCVLQTLFTFSCWIIVYFRLYLPFLAELLCTLDSIYLFLLNCCVLQTLFTFSCCIVVYCKLCLFLKSPIVSRVQ